MTSEKKLFYLDLSQIKGKNGRFQKFFFNEELKCHKHKKEIGRQFCKLFIHIRVKTRMNQYC